MAFYNEENDEEENVAALSQPGAATTGGQSSVISGQGANPSAGVSGTGATNSSLKPDQPGNFVGIKTYLDANKPQAEKLGTQVGQVVTNSAQSLRDSVSTLNSDASNKIKGVSSVGNEVLGTISYGAENLTPQQLAQAKSVSNASYKGPNDYTELGDSYNNAAKKSSEAQQALKDIGTEQGRSQLVTKINSAPRTQGMNVFDSALLQSGGGREKIGNIASQNSDVNDLLSNAKSNIQSQIGRADDPTTPENEATGAIGQTAASQQEAYSTIQNALKSWKDGFSPKVQTAQKNIVDLQNRVTQDIAGSNPYELSEETLSLYGLNEGDKLYDVDLKNYLQGASPSDVNAANVASAEDYARYAALAELSGDTSGILNPANSSLAGTAPSIQANKENLQAAISAAKDPFLQNLWNTSQITPSTITSPDGHFLNSIRTPVQLQGDINKMQKFVTGREGASTTDYAMIQRRIDKARSQMAQWLDGVGSGSNSAIKKV